MRIPSIFLKPGYLSLATVLGVHLLVTDALAERDSFHLGSGRDGALTVSTTGAVVNAYAQVTAALAAGDSVIAVASATGFAAGDLVMLHQSTGVTPVPAAGAQTQIDLTSAGVGRYELARVLSVIGTSITLTAPVINGFAANVTQVIRVPEYTTVTVNPGRSMAPAAWNGVTGGVVAFLANGTLTNNGSVDARGRGFRGGQPVDDTSGTTGATGLDAPAPTGAQKGEGIAVTRYGASNTGRGNVANGAGGGVALKSGGGGGGHGGQGGQGGNSDLNLDGNRVIGGLGGASLTYNLLDHMVFGGGGGAGHSTEVNAGTGGGCIFIRASSLAGAGSFFANGSSSGSATDAASGGGAGGTVILRVAGAATVGAIQATGGTGGSTGSIAIGPGGGGAGGRIYFQKGSGTAALSGTSVIGANSGTQLDPGAPGGSAYGATSGTGGAATTASSGFTSPSTPVILAPANGATGISTTPAYTGTATAGSIVHLLVDNVEIATPTADGSGNFTFTPVASLSSATHTVKAYAEDSTQATFSVLSNTNTFTTGQLAPTVTTATQSTVTATSATLGGEVTAEGGASVTDRGIVWGLAANPTITADTKVANGSGMGTFSATVGSLPSNTLIHVRAYATNSVSTSYGADISFNTLPAVAVTSLNTANATPTNAATVNWTLTFASAVTGVTASNFTLTGAAATGSNVGTPAIASGGGLTWTIPVSTGSIDGTLTLNLANATGLSAAISTSLPFAGQSYTIDKTPPTVQSVTRLTPTGQNTNLTTVTFRVTYSEPVALNNPETARFQVVPVGGSTIVGTVTGVTGTGNTRDVTVNLASGTGEFKLRVID